MAALDSDDLKWPPSPSGEGLILAQRVVTPLHASLHHVLMEPCRGQSDTLSASSAPPREQIFRDQPRQKENWTPAFAGVVLIRNQASFQYVA